MKSLRTLWKWLATLLSGKPHFVVGDPLAPYMLRWYIIPRNRWLNVYLHKFLRDDEDRALHDHPWPSASLLVRGSYVEHVPYYGEPMPGDPEGYIPSDDGKTQFCRFDAPSVIKRDAEYRHRVVLLRDADGRPVPAWTLFITGARVREWGFWCEGVRFVHWRDFCKGDKPGEIGRGCGENVADGR